VRRLFLVAWWGVASSWSIGALFFSLGPQLAGHLLGTTNVVAAGIGIVVLAGAAVVAQRVTGRTAPWITTAAGSVALAAGVLVIVAAAAAGSGTPYLPGS